MDVKPYSIPDYKPYFGGEDYIEMERPPLPDPWDSPVAGFYYVNPDDDNATDSDNTNGSRLVPRKTLPNTTPLGYDIERPPLAAGSVVIVSGHLPTSGNGKIAFCAEGTNANPVWLAGESAENRWSSGQNIFLMGQCMILEYMELIEDGAGSPSMRVHDVYPDNPCNRVCYRYFYGKGSGDFVSGSNTSLSITGDSTNVDEGNPLKRTDVIIYGCDITEMGSTDWTHENGGDAGSHDYHAYSISKAVSRVWVLNNIGDRCQGDGIQIGVAQQASELYPDYLYISGNQFHTNGENSFDVKKVRKVIFSKNDCVTRGASIITHDWCEEVFILNNDIHDSYGGLALQSSLGVYAFGNRIWNIQAGDHHPDQTGVIWGQTYAINTRGCTEVYILNNTVHSYQRGVQAHTSTDCKFSNNVFTGKLSREGQTDPLGEDLIVESGFRDDALMRNNFFDSYRGRFASTSAISTDVEDLNTYGNVGNTGNANSSNINQESAQGITHLTLLSGSDMIDAGISEDLIYVNNLFNTTFSLSIDRDLLGYVRLQGSGYDIGFNEYGGVFAPALPLAPKSLSIDAGEDKIEWTLDSLNETGITVYEDDIVIATLGAGATEYSHVGVATSINQYRVGASNAEGEAQSKGIYSDIMSVTQLPDTFTEDLNITKSHLAVRPYEYSNDGLLNIGEPQYVGDKFGILSTDIEFTKDSASVGNGFNYITNDSGSISGSVSGTGDCDIITTINSYDGVATGRLQVGSTYVDITCTEGAFDKYKTTLGVTGTKEYTFTPITTNAKHAIGLVSLQEK
jgi:hypothetical protein